MRSILLIFLLIFSTKAVSAQLLLRPAVPTLAWSFKAKSFHAFRPLSVLHFPFATDQSTAQQFRHYLPCWLFHKNEIFGKKILCVSKSRVFFRKEVGGMKNNKFFV